MPIDRDSPDGFATPSDGETDRWEVGDIVTLKMFDGRQITHVYGDGKGVVTRVLADGLLYDVRTSDGDVVRIARWQLATNFGLDPGDVP